MLRLLMVVVTLLQFSIEANAAKWDWDRVRTTMKIKMDHSNGELESILSVLDRVSAPKNVKAILDPQGWRYRGAFYSRIHSIGNEIRIPILENQTLGVFHRQNTLSLFRESRVFDLVLEVSEGAVKHARLESCGNSRSEFAFEAHRQYASRDQFEESLPSNFSILGAVFKYGVDELVMNMSIFMSESFNIEVTPKESEMSQRYGAWYLPFHLSL
ncbi:MAG: hypothetical protein KDD25_07730, partial [Bdellovibrionales bacterium]|nr:hypothetical protein [Bdellovibrionales bacterium]